MADKRSDMPYTDEVERATTEANLIGKKFGLTTKVEREGGGFRWAFFRHGRYVGSTRDAARVVPAVKQFISTH